MVGQQKKRQNIDQKGYVGEYQGILNQTVKIVKLVLKLNF